MLRRKDDWAAQSGVDVESYEEKLNGYDLPLTSRRIRVKDRPKDWPTRVWQIR